MTHTSFQMSLDAESPRNKEYPTYGGRCRLNFEAGSEKIWRPAYAAAPADGHTGTSGFKMWQVLLVGLWCKLVPGLVP